MKRKDRYFKPTEMQATLAASVFSECVFVCRRCFVIYRYPGKPPTVISMDHFVDKVMEKLPVWPGAAL